MKNRNFTRTGLAVIAAMFVFCASTNVFAQEAAPAKIIVVNLGEVISTSLAGKELIRQGKTYGSEIEADNAKNEQQGREFEAEIRRQEAVLAKEALQAKAQEYQQKYMNSRAAIQDKANRVQTALSNAEKDIMAALNPIYQQLLTKYNANMVAESRMFLATGQVIDVTREVIQKLDQSMPTIKVNVPAASAAPKP